jgi:hypothetical protein
MPQSAPKFKAETHHNIATLDRLTRTLTLARQVAVVPSTVATHIGTAHIDSSGRGEIGRNPALTALHSRL